MTSRTGIEDLLRELAPQVLGTLVRRHGQFDACEDAVQEALLAGGLRWTDGGVPDDPRAWLVTVASRRLVDGWRSESARRRREEITAAMEVTPPDQLPDRDDTLTLLFLCCHPALSIPSQLALTLRAVGGLTTGEIAKAFLVPEATMAQRISRAKERIRDEGAHFDLPPEQERAERLRVVLHVLYLVFNEGYAATAGPGVTRADLTTEAIRLTRLLHRLMPTDGEVAGLLALMLLTDARRAARAGEDGSLVPLAEQRRELWNAAQIVEGVSLVTGTLGSTPVGPYQVQAAIAAIHDEAPTAGATDWPQILALYEVLERVSPGPRRHVEPRGGGRDGPRSASWPCPPRDHRGRRPHDPNASARCRPRPSPRARRRHRCRSRRVPTGRDADREPSRTPLPDAAGRPPRASRADGRQ
jgi:RNA polymerase sigma factor (sigma-70 family)